jgi:hypothetical protein
MERRGINRVAPSLKWLIWGFVIVVLLAIALADLKRVSSEAVSFSVTDPEVAHWTGSESGLW